MSLFHRHKFSEVKNGYQYCVDCGEAKTAPECQHKFETIKIVHAKYVFLNGTATVYHLRCSLCGKIDSETIEG